ncbi:MAG: hypothetical protein IH984_07660 [Planctomycetes bacterium]|nr:hypothetical protein [Planctomycetota bacterium]
MKLLRVIGISLGLAVFVSLCACKDDPKGLRQNQNPPQPVPGPNTGFVTDPQDSNSNTNTLQEDPSKTDTAPEGS